jgi:hypothetical protein
MRGAYEASSAVAGFRPPCLSVLLSDKNGAGA